MTYRTEKRESEREGGGEGGKIEDGDREKCGCIRERKKE